MNIDIHTDQDSLINVIQNVVNSDATSGSIVELVENDDFVTFSITTSAFVGPKFKQFLALNQYPHIMKFNEGMQSISSSIMGTVDSTSSYSFEIHYYGNCQRHLFVFNLLQDIADNFKTNLNLQEVEAIELYEACTAIPFKGKTAPPGLFGLQFKIENKEPIDWNFS